MIDAETMEKFSTMKGFETKMSEPLSTRMMIVNTTKGALQDKNVRKAIQHVLDKKLYLKVYLVVQNSQQIIFLQKL